MSKQYITYEPVEWADGVEGGTPINAGNLGRMEGAIEALVEKVNTPITSDDIGEGAVGNTQIAADSVTSDKLAKPVQDLLSLAVKTVESSPGLSGRCIDTISILNGNLRIVSADGSVRQVAVLNAQ